jgi:hypothetical protein
MRGFSWAFGRTDGAHAQAIDSVSSSKAEVLALDAALPRELLVIWYRNRNLVVVEQLAGTLVATAQKIGEVCSLGSVSGQTCFGPVKFGMRV